MPRISIDILLKYQNKQYLIVPLSGGIVHSVLNLGCFNGS